MNHLEHRDYYAKRAAASRELAQHAAAPNIAAIHIELASRYEDLAARPDRGGEITMTLVQAT